MSRSCSMCKIEKPFADFSRDASQKTGYRPSCKSCNGKSTLKMCAICEKNFIGGKTAKHCRDCVRTKSNSELYHPKKPVSKCATCDKQARSSACKYCGVCAAARAEKREQD